MAAADRAADPLPYRLLRRDGLLVFDPRPTLHAILEGVGAGTDAGLLAARFQATVVAVTRELCADAAAATGIRTACLSGGVFQNQWLVTELLERLAGDGFEVHVNEHVPVNDGGISYGQAAVAAARMSGGGATAGPSMEVA
jgi:hydrogenase maturation protein HypF